jgi:hypothetical protein
MTMAAAASLPLAFFSASKTGSANTKSPTALGRKTTILRTSSNGGQVGRDTVSSLRPGCLIADVTARRRVVRRTTG